MLSDFFAMRRNTDHQGETLAGALNAMLQGIEESEDADGIEEIEL